MQNQQEKGQGYQQSQKSQRGGAQYQYDQGYSQSYNDSTNQNNNSYSKNYGGMQKANSSNQNSIGGAKVGQKFQDKNDNFSQQKYMESGSQRQLKPWQSQNEEPKISQQEKSQTENDFKHNQVSELKIMALSNQGPKIFSLKCQNSQVEQLIQDNGYPDYPTAEIAKFSPLSGKYLAVVDFNGIHVTDMSSKKQIISLKRKGIVSLEWSPRETFLISCEKPKTNPDFNNLNVWKVNKDSLQNVGSFDWQNKAKDGSLSIKFDQEERFSTRQIAQNMIEVYEGGNFQQPKLQVKSKLPPLPKVNGKVQEDDRIDNSRFDGFQLCPSPEENKGVSSAPCYLMAWQNGEVLSEEDNGLVYVYDLNSSLQRPKFNIPCPRAHNIQIIPAPSGHAILVWSQNLNDTTGKSYYGEHSLQYVRIHKGKNRAFIPIFDNQIQDVQWTPDGQQFIVISGQQPATATLYNADGEPKFEFGKRFRNTAKICPFSSILICGGFGNINKGEMDFWNLETLKEIGKAKFPCATKIQWSPCGRYVLASILYERLKVDNSFQIFRANGSKILSNSEKFDELHYVELQPHEAGLLSKPDISKLRKEEEKKQNEKDQLPKKIFKFGKGGGENSAFQQMMRQQMASGAGEKVGPKRVDANQYKELQEQQTAKAQQIIQSQANTFAASMTPSSKDGNPDKANQSQKQIAIPQKPQKKDNDSGPNWRMGKFHDDNDDQQYFTEQKEQEAQSALASQISNIKINESSQGKNKKGKKKMVVQSNPGLQKPIISEDDPSLDQLYS